MVLRGATSVQGALEGVGPENRDFFGPCGTSEASKPLSISAIKTTVTLIVLCTRLLLCNVVVCCCVLLCVRGMGRSPCICVV